ncbi:hypothetical protein [Sphingomonas beigongshangi]|uniref:hypothetical protein n=1 Tax=Sphingomonas beigongshangi TaxID=2782540 RepID=UPI00193C66E4|nr:hypothetical protein [Sphingomonas beigongshangi]
MKLAALALATVLLPGAALAQQLQPANEKPAKPAKAKQVCRRDPNTGTRMAQMICHTSEEWAQIDNASSSAASDAMDRQRRGN